MAPRLSIDITDKRFGAGEPVFSGFNLAVKPGEVLVILGASGIGKSTLLRLIAGIDADFSGSIEHDGVPAREAAAPGMVFQDARLLPWLTALDNVLLAKPTLGRDRALELLARVELADAGALYPRQLSGGMQRRVALARALATNPGLLLLDEPFVSLDAALRAEMRTLLASMFDANGSTAVLVTHDPDDAARLGDRAIVLAGHPARITADLTLAEPRAGRAEETVARYQADLLLALEPATLD